MQHWKPEIPDEAEAADAPSQMMHPADSSFWIAFCNRMRGSMDPFTMACTGAAGGLVLWMVIGFAAAWWEGRL